MRRHDREITDPVRQQEIIQSCADWDFNKAVLERTVILRLDVAQMSCKAREG